jgi:hypothetical protein
MKKNQNSKEEQVVIAYEKMLNGEGKLLVNLFKLNFSELPHTKEAARVISNNLTKEVNKYRKKYGFAYIDGRGRFHPQTRE